MIVNGDIYTKCIGARKSFHYLLCIRKFRRSWKTPHFKPLENCIYSGSTVDDIRMYGLEF